MENVAVGGGGSLEGVFGGFWGWALVWVYWILLVPYQFIFNFYKNIVYFAIRFILITF